MSGDSIAKSLPKMVYNPFAKEFVPNPSAEQGPFDQLAARVGVGVFIPDLDFDAEADLQAPKPGKQKGKNKQEPKPAKTKGKQKAPPASHGSKCRGPTNVGKRNCYACGLGKKCKGVSSSK
jgi:hypothetical protein